VAEPNQLSLHSSLYPGEILGSRANDQLLDRCCGLGTPGMMAVFRAWPSPFYVLDKVEAALDETNLNRLIALFELLRDRSQLIVITHQKATMEVADALYGVSMRGDGITTVILQRLRGAGSSAGAA
jgi:predicted ATPase